MAVNDDLTEAQVEEFFSTLSNWGKWGTNDQLGAACLPWIHERKIAVLGCDGVSDVVPSGYDNLIMPIHSCTLVAMGIHLFDNCMLDDLSEACASRSHWTFMLTVAPLVLVKGTASPINPIAVF